MRKFFFTLQPSNDLGLLAQSLPIARQLRDRGYQVDFCTSGNAPTKVIRDSGFINYRPHWVLYLILSGDARLINFIRLLGSKYLKRDFKILSWYLKHMKKHGTSEIWNIDHFMYVMGMGNETYTRAVVRTMSKILLKHKPDAVVNFWNPFASIATKINKIPLISVIQADLHPDSNGFIWWKEKPNNLPTPLPAVNKIMAENKLPTIHSIGDLSVGDLTLVLGTPETDPLPDATTINYIGSLLLQEEHEKLPDWVDDLNKDLPVIWMYPGNTRYIKGEDSPFDGLAILRAGIKALENMDVQVVLTTGGHELPKEILPLPSNFRYRPFVPGLAMAKRCDLMIHHGGYGSSQTGLYAGTPAIIVPTYSERESNARRVAAVGAGEFILPVTDASGKKKFVDALELRAKIKRVLSDHSYKENAVRISGKLKKLGGAPGAATIIENFIPGTA